MKSSWAKIRQQKKQAAIAIRMVMEALNKPATVQEIAEHQTLRGYSKRSIGQHLRRMGRRDARKRWHLTKQQSNAVVAPQTLPTPHRAPRTTTKRAAPPLSIDKSVRVVYDRALKELLLVADDAEFPFEIR